MFGIKGRDTFNKPLSNRAQIAQMVKEKWLKYFPYLLIFAIVSIIIFLGYVWYMYVYTKELSVDEKATYINEKKQEVVFRQKKFDEIRDMINMRNENLNAQRVEYRDPFYPSVVQSEENEDVEE
jgi:cbb3-type cytochrome oxidase subunit 3